VLLYNWTDEAVVGKYRGPEKDITQVNSTSLQRKNQHFGIFSTLQIVLLCGLQISAVKSLGKFASPFIPASTKLVNALWPLLQYCWTHLLELNITILNM